MIWFVTMLLGAIVATFNGYIGAGIIVISLAAIGYAYYEVEASKFWGPLYDKINIAELAIDIREKAIDLSYDILKGISHDEIKPQADEIRRLLGALDKRRERFNKAIEEWHSPLGLILKGGIFTLKTKPFPKIESDLRSFEKRPEWKQLEILAKLIDETIEYPLLVLNEKNEEANFYEKVRSHIQALRENCLENCEDIDPDRGDQGEDPKEN